METLKLISDILVVVLSIFILVITLMTHLVIKKNDRSILKAQIRTMGTDTTGRIVYRWLLILVGASGAYWGAGAGTYILMVSALITERLLTYRVCRPDDRLGRFLTKYNW